MSITVMSYVWEHSRRKGTDLLTLLAIADFVHDDGTGAYPSIATLAKKTRMTERNVQLVLRKLQDSKELRIDQGAGPKGCHLFTVVIARGEKMSGGEKISGVKSSVKGGEIQCQKGVKPASPNPLGDPSKDPLLPLPSEEVPHLHVVKHAHGPKTRLPSKRCPPDYRPAPSVYTWAAEKYPDIDVDTEWEAMRDHEYSRAHHDWDAVLRSWIRETVRRGQRYGSSNRAASFAQRQQALAAWAAEEEARHEQA